MQNGKKKLLLSLLELGIDEYVALKYYVGIFNR